jgi:hypothetical protein
VGVSRILVFVLVLGVPLLGCGFTASAVGGPYAIACQDRGSGFQVVVMSGRTGAGSTYVSPLGACPPA